MRKTMEKLKHVVVDATKIEEWIVEKEYIMVQSSMSCTIPANIYTTNKVLQ